MIRKLNIKIILGSTRDGRFGEQPSQWIHKELSTKEGVDVELLDLRDYPMPFFDQAVTPSNPDAHYTHPVVVKWTKKIEEADGFIWVSPEYNHGYSAVIKNAIDFVYHGWAKKPVAFLSYGSQGGARAVEQLTLVARELQMAPLKHAIYIVAPWNLKDEEGKLITESLEHGLDPMLDNLIWWGLALKTARETT